MPHSLACNDSLWQVQIPVTKLHLHVAQLTVSETSNVDAS